MAPGQIDPAVAPLRRANPHRFQAARPGHIAVVAMAGRPWFIGRVCGISERPPRTTCRFADVINIDTGEMERIPAPWIVELMTDQGLQAPRP